jgi:hypothetical protein
VSNLRLERLFSTGLRGLGYVEHVDGVDVHSRLATNAETADQSAIALDIATLHVIEQTATLANELHESTAGVVITLVNLEVLGEVRDPVRQNRDLNLGRARVRSVSLKVLDDLLLLSHNVFAL